MQILKLAQIVEIYLDGRTRANNELLNSLVQNINNWNSYSPRESSSFFRHYIFRDIIVFFTLSGHLPV